MANSEEIREYLEDIDSDESDLSIFRNLSDSDDPEYQASSDDSVSSESDHIARKRRRTVLVNDEHNYVGLLPGMLANPQPTTSAQDSSEEMDQIQSQNVTRPNIESVKWGPVTGNLHTFNFNLVGGLQPHVIDQLPGRPSEIDCYNVFVDDAFVEYIVKETNLYANQSIVKCILHESIGTHSRLALWKDITALEMRQFLGLLIWMGLDNKPKLQDYWSKSILYDSKVSKVMARNRFELILSNLHFADNEQYETDPPKLYKIQKLIDCLKSKFQNAFIPKEHVCIDETMIPFRGRLKIRQYLPKKRHKYGLKMYKLCLEGGYTWNIKLYAGKESSMNTIHSEVVVMELITPLLDTGRTLVTDNFYTSVRLASKLTQRKTHLIGTLKKKESTILGQLSKRF